MFEYLLEDAKSLIFPRKCFISAALVLNCNPGLVIFSLFLNVHSYKFSYSRVGNCKKLKNESSNSL